MATAGQLHARQLQMVEVVMITTSTSTVSSKPSPPLFSSGLSVSALESGDRPAAAAGIPPSAEPARRRRQWPRCRAVPHQQDRRACTERLHPPYAASLADEVLVEAVIPGQCTIAQSRLHHTRRSSASAACCSNPLPSAGQGDQKRKPDEFC